MKYPAVAMLLATKAFTRAIRSASECSFKTMVLGFLATVFAVEDSISGSLRLAGGGLPPREGVLIWSGHRVSQSSDRNLRRVSVGRLVGETFEITWPVIELVKRTCDCG